MGFKIGRSSHRVQTAGTQRASAPQQFMISMNAGEVAALCAIKTALLVYWPSFNVFFFDKPFDKPIMERLARRRRPDVCMMPQPGDDVETLKMKRQFVNICDRAIVQWIQDRQIRELWNAVDKEVLKLLNKPIEELDVEQMKALEVEFEKVKSLELMESGFIPKWFVDALKTSAKLSRINPAGGNSFTDDGGNGN